MVEFDLLAALAGGLVATVVPRDDTAILVVQGRSPRGGRVPHEERLVAGGISPDGPPAG